MTSTKAFDFSLVEKCRIHPGIGIARVGNSPAEYFIGPEAPPDLRTITPPRGSYKDADGRIKRQAARFRIYAYDKAGNNLGELPLLGKKSPQSAAGVVWSVHLKNKKGASFKFHSRFEQPKDVRNADVPFVKGAHEKRTSLVIDPGPRGIDGNGTPIKNNKYPGTSTFDTGTFRGTIVSLGELKVDDYGRLLVLGGLGKSASTKPDNPIGADPTKEDFWANNDYWYDDISDGKITATITLPNNKTISIDNSEDASWVIVAPPKYAPGIYPIVTLYDVARQVAIDQKWIEDDDAVEFYRDIYPILSRTAETSWVNKEAQRGHGFDKEGDFHALAAILAQPGTARDERASILRRIRKPLANDASDANTPNAIKQATPSSMPPLSGDGGDRTDGVATTWLSVLPSQYRKLEKWGNHNFQPGVEQTFPDFDCICDPNAQVEALQRAALEPCIGGGFYPGVEASWTVRKASSYAGAFRFSPNLDAGDITKNMCLPWQAGLFDCKDTWWPAARPDDVIPEDVFEEANKAWRSDQPKLIEALEGRVKWDRGLGVTTLFRLPWQNPADAIEDPRNIERRGCDDMVRYWHELGFVLPVKTAWSDANTTDIEVVHVERERRPHAGMDVRELFHCLVNIEENRSCLPKVQEFVESVLAASRDLQKTADAFAFMDNIRPFKYDDAVFDARMRDIYDDCADFAFSENIDGRREKWIVSDPDHNPYFRTRENVIERIRQLTPFNFLDGAWLRNIHNVGPVDEVNAILFTILKEELGDGVVSQNHANIYRDLCHSFGFYPAEMNSTAFARDPRFLDCAFDSPVFQLGISEFSKRYYPEIIGMSLWLEWTVMELHRISAMVENESVKLNSHFYRMHIAIDNAANGHGAAIIRAVKLYLARIRAQGGDQAVQEHWKRIWDGYVAFAYTFVIVIKQVIRIIQAPPSLQQRLEWLITEKAPYAQYNHGDTKIGRRKINQWFSDPKGFLQALHKPGDGQKPKFIPGRPDESGFFKLLEFRGGPMYHVFTEDEIKLWRDWCLELGSCGKLGVAALRHRLAAINPQFEKAIKDASLLTWQSGVHDFRIVLWLEIAMQRIAAPSSPNAEPQYIADIKNFIDDRFRTWIGGSMVRATTYIAKQYCDVVKDLSWNLPDPRGTKLTIAQWFERIRAAPNPAVPAIELLKALAAAIQHNETSLEKLFAEGEPLRYAFETGIPGNDARVAKDTAQAWVDAGYPLPPIPDGGVKALRIDGSLSAEELHPTGLMMGFGTVH
jgi:hypothetical protein